jgi:hypothetical protein
MWAFNMLWLAIAQRRASRAGDYTPSWVFALLAAAWIAVVVFTGWMVG